MLALARSAGALPVDAQATDPDFIIARLLQKAAATRAENGDCYCRGCSHDCQAGGGAGLSSRHAHPAEALPLPHLAAARSWSRAPLGAFYLDDANSIHRT